MTARVVVVTATAAAAAMDTATAALAREEAAGEEKMPDVMVQGECIISHAKCSDCLLTSVQSTADACVEVAVCVRGIC